MNTLAIIQGQKLVETTVRFSTFEIFLTMDRYIGYNPKP